MTSESDRQAYRIYDADSIGAAIRHFRVESGLSQEQLAELTGLDRFYLSELEHGKETEQLKRILRILNQLGMRLVIEKADW